MQPVLTPIVLQGERARTLRRGSPRRRFAGPSAGRPSSEPPRKPSFDLDLRTIRCFLILADERHYQRAAARLHMSQPGLSRTIASLEARVGAILVVRSVRPVTLTRQGEILAAHGRRLLNAQQKAFDAMVDDASRPSSALS
jgi:hypothetical protein